MPVVPVRYILLFASLTTVVCDSFADNSSPRFHNRSIESLSTYPFKSFPAFSDIKSNTNSLQARGEKPPDPRKHLRGGALRGYNNRSRSTSRTPSPGSPNQGPDLSRLFAEWRGRSLSPGHRSPNQRADSPSLLDELRERFPSPAPPGTNRHTGVSSNPGRPVSKNPLISSIPHRNVPPPQQSANIQIPERQRASSPSLTPGERPSGVRLNGNPNPLDLSVLRPDHPVNRPRPPSPPRMYHEPWRDTNNRISLTRLRELFPPRNSPPLDLSIFRPDHPLNRPQPPPRPQLYHEPWRDPNDRISPSRLRELFPPQNNPPLNPSALRSQHAVGQPRPVQELGGGRLVIENANIDRSSNRASNTGVSMTSGAGNVRSSATSARAEPDVWPNGARRVMGPPDRFPQRIQVSLAGQRGSQATGNQNPVQHQSPFQNSGSPWQPAATQLQGVSQNPSPVRNPVQEPTPFRDAGSPQQPGAAPVPAASRSLNPLYGQHPSQSPSIPQHAAQTQNMNPRQHPDPAPRRIENSWFRTGIGSPEGTDRGFTTWSVAEMAAEAQRLSLNPFQSPPVGQRPLASPKRQQAQGQSGRSQTQSQDQVSSGGSSIGPVERNLTPKRQKKS